MKNCAFSHLVELIGRIHTKFQLTGSPRSMVYMQLCFCQIYWTPCQQPKGSKWSAVPVPCLSSVRGSRAAAPEGTKSCRTWGESIHPSIGTYVRPPTPSSGRKVRCSCVSATKKKEKPSFNVVLSIVAVYRRLILNCVVTNRVI